MSETIQWREPADFTVGDTLLFQRNLPDYLPSDGWAIRLTITENTATGATKLAEAVSTPDTTSQYHVFNVPNFCAGLAAGKYVLSEEVFNAAGNAALNISAGEKHQIYVRPDFQLQDDLADGLAT
ncbi:MAG: hypothetical protein KGJ13_12960, partial [Patescibacteria group bacterium]|nr:hypothetical protein [Patescibacteria group bacterium]